MHGSFTNQEVEHILHAKKGIADYVELAFSRFRGYERGALLESFIKDNFVVSGGISASLFTGTAIKDIDLYYNRTVDVTELDKLLRQNFIEVGAPFRHFIKSVNPTYMVGEVEGKLVTANAITLINDMQLIRLAGIKECQQVFDFKHCLPVYELKSKVYKISYNSYDSMLHKTLLNHTGTVKQHRLEKFKQRGWSLLKLS